MKIIKITLNIVIISAIFSMATLVSFSYINHLQQIPLAHAEGDGGDGGDGDAGDGGTGDAGDSGAGDAGVGAIGDAGVGGTGDGGSPSAGITSGPGGPGITSTAPPSAPPATPPSTPPSTPPTAPPEGPPGGGGPFLGVCLDTAATNYGGTLPCLYPAGTPITLAKKITPLSYVYLSQVPYTGIADNALTYSFLITLFGISGFISYQFMYGKKENLLSLAGIGGLRDALKFSLPSMHASKTESARVETRGYGHLHSSAIFVKALLERDHDVAFMVLRSIEREEASVKTFIVKTIAEIETAYRIKMGETGSIHPTTAEAIEKHSPATLEILLTHLISAVNSPFTSHALAAQIAVVKITEALQAQTLTVSV